MNYGLRNIAYKLMYKKVDEDQLDIIHIKKHTSDISYFNFSTNSIRTFQYNGKLYYFRECPLICKFEEYFEYYYSNFFLNIKQIETDEWNFKQKLPINVCFSDEVIFSFREYMDKKKENTDFIKRMSKIDFYAEKYHFSIWNERNVYDDNFWHIFGFDDIQYQFYDIAIYFLWNIRSAVLNYRTFQIVRGKRYSFFYAVKSISTRIIAEELQLDHMITDVQWCMLELETGEAILGILSDAAPGHRMLDCSIAANGSLQKELMNLNVLDVICCQMDHGPNNYNIYCDKENVCSICAFDNDNPYTFFPIPVINLHLACADVFTNKKNIIQRPYFDQDVAKHLDELDLNALKHRLRPYLNFIQIKVLIIRIKKLNRAVKKTKHYKKEFLLDSTEWNYETVKRELSGQFGETYLTKAVVHK